MGELCLIASHGYLPGSGGVFHQEKSSIRASEDFRHFLPHHASIQELVKSLSLNLSAWRKDEWRSIGGLLNSSHFARTDCIPNRPALIDLQGTHPDSVRFSNGIAERCYRHEMILKLLASGSIGEPDSLIDISMLYDLMEPESAIADLPRAEPGVSCSKWCCNDPPPLQHLIYPTKELFLHEPVLNLVGDGCISPEKSLLVGLDPQYDYPCTEMNDILDLYSPKSKHVSSKKASVVPYFERRKRSSGKTEASKLATENIGTSTKISDQVKEKTSTKKKNNLRTGKASNNSISYSRACESLLSIIVDTNKQGRGTILSLKKSSPELAQILTQCSATIAGAGVAIVLSHLFRVAFGTVPFCTSKLLSTGFGLGLVWLSWAVNKLRGTIITISKTSSKLVEKEDEMMSHLDRNLKDVYLRAATVMVLAVMRMA